MPVRATVSGFGPLLLSKVLGLNETQESSLGLVFHYADANGLALVDLSDLRAVLTYLTGDEGKAELKNLGGLSAATAGVILRELITFADQGADVFFGEPEFDVADFLRIAPDGRGIISLLEVPGVVDKPALFSTFLMYLLAELFEILPEVGDPDKPKLVFFFDEAHLLFKDASKDFLAAIVQTVRLIRSKGVGVFFVTQTPKDVPSDVLAQLGSRVQHALRAFTPDDAKALRATVGTYPKSGYDLERVLQELGTGEAIVTVMSEKGAPTPVAWTRLRAPQGLMSPTPDPQIEAAVKASLLLAKYGTAIDRESAREILTAKMNAADEAQAAAEAARREGEGRCRVRQAAGRDRQGAGRGRQEGAAGVRAAAQEDGRHHPHVARDAEVADRAGARIEDDADDPERRHPRDLRHRQALNPAPAPSTVGPLAIRRFLVRSRSAHRRVASSSASSSPSRAAAVIALAVAALACGRARPTPRHRPSEPVTATDFCFVESMIFYRVEATYLADALLDKDGISPEARSSRRRSSPDQSAQLDDGLRPWYVSWNGVQTARAAEEGPCAGHGNHRQMPGMPTAAQWDALIAADGAEAERLFAEYLIAQDQAMIDSPSRCSRRTRIRASASRPRRRSRTPSARSPPWKGCWPRLRDRRGDTCCSGNDRARMPHPRRHCSVGGLT